MKMEIRDKNRNRVASRCSLRHRGKRGKEKELVSISGIGEAWRHSLLKESKR